MTAQLRGQILRFAAVGGVGFVVDGGLLWILTSSDVNPYLSRAISFPIAVLSTWLLNRSWTFRDAAKTSRRSELMRYFSVQMVGSTTNYILYALCVALFGETQQTIFAGFVIGSAAGSVLNFVGARYFAFRAHL